MYYKGEEGLMARWHDGTMARWRCVRARGEGGGGTAHGKTPNAASRPPLTGILRQRGVGGAGGDIGCNEESMVLTKISLKE